ncbi:MAG: hypothetical protein GY816_24385, partial [Cytophagales bacterium]|nr:hypothetical protein [Cytophagales bacterium]
TNEKWWVNVIQAKDNGSYTIKNIAAKHPEHVTEKIYHQRTFFMWDLNPKTVSVSDVPNDLGRFVKGKLVRIEGFKGENKIATRKDGRVGSMVSYIHISIPNFLEDSVQGYSLKVKEKLSNALYLNARVLNTNNIEENVDLSFKTFRGNYVSEDSTTYLNFEIFNKRLVRFKLKKNMKIEVGTIGYDEEQEVIYYFQASGNSHIIRRFKFDEEARDLKLREESGDGIYVIGRNTIEFSINGKTERFFRY